MQSLHTASKLDLCKPVSLALWREGRGTMIVLQQSWTQRDLFVRLEESILFRQSGTPLSRGVLAGAQSCRAKVTLQGFSQAVLLLVYLK